MERVIQKFHLNRFQEWEADLECGHAVMMRHNPPYQNCPWIGTPKGRQEHIGDLTECVSCDMPSLPDNLKLVDTSPLYQRDSIPEEFGSGYVTEDGVWAKVVVKTGLLQFLINAEPSVGFVLDEQLYGVMKPGVGYAMKPAMGEVEFYIEFYQAL